MRRPSMPTVLALLAAALLASPAPAAAEAPTGDEPVRMFVRLPRESFIQHATVSPILVLERCVGGCMVRPGPSDARAMTSGIVSAPSTVDEFTDRAGQSGAAADETWDALVQCVREVYSPFAVQVTDTKPTGGQSFHLAIVAGRSSNIGLPANILGIAGGAGCEPADNVISFSFANAHAMYPPSRYLYELCATVAQESAHAFGLPNHAWEYLDGRSACNDPMTYRGDCGGQKFFRNEQVRCGDFMLESCSCGSTQNSHLKLLSIFGKGQSLIPAPTVEITTPAASGGALPGAVVAMASSRRGVAKVELLLNGYKWAEAPGAAFGANGQPATAYPLTVPGEIPNSVVDVVVRACDDIDECTDSAPVTVTKGAPCTSADTCLAGQKCEQGKCYWDPPSGQIGDGCTYPQFCESGVCQGTAEEKICTRACIVGVADSCPDGLTCYQAGASAICFFPPDDSGGCCSVGHDGGLPWAHAGASALLLGVLLRRRRRR